MVGRLIPGTSGSGGGGGGGIGASSGGLVTAGHSYTQLGPQAESLADNFANYTHRLAAALNISPDEVYSWGRSGGTWLTNSDGQDGDVQSVTSVIAKFVFPSHSYSPTQVPLQTSKCWPATWILNAGINDPVRALLTPTGGLAAGIKNSARFAVSRALAAVLYLSTNTSNLAFSGFSTTTAAPRPVSTSGIAPATAYSTGPSFRISITDGDTITFTLPLDFTGGTVVFGFHGCPQVGTALSSPGVDAFTGTIPVSDILGYYLQIKNGDVIQIDSEQMLVGSGGGTTSLTVTRGVNGTSAASHSTAARVFLPTTNARVNWSGTATGATGTTYLSGTGASSASFRTGCHVAQRFTLTAADAGATIIATTAGIVGNEYVAFDSAWIEDSEPSPVLLVNQPLMSFPSTAGAFDATTGPIVNTALSELAAEFPSTVQVVDVATPFAALYGATIHTATSTGTTISITPVSASQNILRKGHVLRCQSEEMLITSDITKTSDTQWTFTVTRNYTGSGSGTGGAASTGNVNHAVGVGIYNTLPWARDRIHPSDVGHTHFAEYCLTELETITMTNAKAASTSALVMRRGQRARPSYYRTALYYSSATRTTVALTQSTAYAFPMLFNEAVNIEEMGFEVTTLSASSVVRLGLYYDGPGRPGALAYDFGTVSTATTGDKFVTPFVPIKPGIIWAVFVPQTAASATFRAASAGNTSDPAWYQWYNHSTRPTGATGVQFPSGYSATGVTGALAATFPTAGETFLTAATLPIIWLKVGLPLRD